jgi:hypothetical protein
LKRGPTIVGGERYPEGSIERGDPRSLLVPGVDLELLSERELDDGLILSASNQRYAASKYRDQKSDHRPHHR